MHRILFILELEILIQSRHKMSSRHKTASSPSSPEGHWKGERWQCPCLCGLKVALNAGPEDCTYRE